MTYQPKTSSGKCVFCEIVNGTIETPGIFWKNNDFMAFLSIDPNTVGFSCIIPKKHYESDVFKMPDEILPKFILAAKEVANILENYFEDVGRIGLIAEGMGVDHAHFKLVPLHGTENLKRGEWRQIISDKRFWSDKYEGWIASAGGPKNADPQELKNLAENLKKFQNQ